MPFSRTVPCNPVSEADVIDHLVHCASRFRSTRTANDTCGNTGDSRAGFDRLQDHGTSSDPGVRTELYVTKNGSTCSDEHPAPYFGMSVASVFTCPSERDVLQDRYVVLDNTGFANDDSGGMVEENASTELDSWMNIDLEDTARSGLQPGR